MCTVRNSLKTPDPVESATGVCLCGGGFNESSEGRVSARPRAAK